MREKHGAGIMPKSINDLAAPKALDGLPSLQALWDEAIVQYKESLYQALVSAREEKLATQYSSAVKEEIIKSLVGDIKKICADKSTADPTHQPSIQSEGKATFELFTKSITLWEQQARDQALQQFQKQQERDDSTESKALDQANVSNTQSRAEKDTNNSVELYHWPATRPQVPPLPSKGQHQREGQQFRTIQRQLQRQPEGECQGEGSSRKRKGKGNVTIIEHNDPLLTTVNIIHSKPKNRRLSKA